jgi:hypothetical protein
MIEDRFKNALEHLANEGELDGGKEALYSLVSSIPLAGGPISSLLTGAAKRRVVERSLEVFQAVKDRLDEVEKTNIDEAYFKSDEFMTILLLAIEQLQTTHDKQKLQMIANALANSGNTHFSADSRKELFMRTMRDLSPEHVAFLAAAPSHHFAENPTGENLTIYQSLAAHGLLEESYEQKRPEIPHGDFTSQGSAARAISKMILTPTIHRFRVSKFGTDFLEFFASQGKG